MQRGFNFVLLVLLMMGLLYEFSEAQYLALGIAGILVLGVCAVNLVQAMGLLLFAIALSPEMNVAGIPLRIEDLIIPAIIIFALIRMSSRKLSLKSTRMMTPILFFLFFMLISTLNAIIVNPDINGIQAFFHFLKHIEYIFIFLLVLNVVDSTEDIQFLMYCVIGAGFVLAVQSIYFPFGLIGIEEVASEIGSEVDSQIQRLHGVATETANIFGGYLVFHILFVTGVLIEDDWLPRKILLGIIFCTMSYPLLFTMSRSSYAGLVVGLLLVGILRDPKIILAMLLGGFVVLTLLPEAVIGRFLSIFTALTETDLAPSWQARLEAWQEYIPVIIRNPFIGKGLFYISPGEVDNEFVLRGVETGILGLLSFLWVLLAFWRRSVKLFKSEDKIFRQISVGFGAGLLGLCVHSLAATSFTAIRTAEPFYFTSGLVIAAYLMSLGVGRQHKSIDIRRKEVNKKMETEHEQILPV
jgi:hypothetical protein